MTELYVVIFVVDTIVAYVLTRMVWEEDMRYAYDRNPPVP